MMRPYLLCALFLLAACSDAPATEGTVTGAERGAWAPPPPGTIVAADSMKTDDALNDFYFAVKLTVSADNEGVPGDYGFVYDVATHYGPGTMTGKVSMPSGGKSLRPLLRKDAAGKYRYVIGFIAGKELGGDGRTFQDLYSVEGSKEKVEIRPLKSYQFR